MKHTRLFFAAAIFTIGGCFAVLDDYDAYKLQETAVEPPPICPSTCYGDGTPSALQDVGACKSGTPVCQGAEIVTCNGWGAPSLELCNVGTGQDADEDCNHSACAHVFDWSHRIGDTMNGETLSGVVLSGDGSVVLSGSYTGTIGLGGNSPTITGTDTSFIAKYAADGTPAWIRNISYMSQPQHPATVRGIAIDGNNRIFLAGQFNFNGVLYGQLAMMTPDGVLSQSSYQFGAMMTTGDLNAVAVDTNGAVYTVGTITSISTNKLQVPCANPAVLHDSAGIPNMILVRSHGTTGTECRYGMVFPGGKHVPRAVAVATVASKATGVVVGTYEGGLSALPAAPAGRPNGFVLQFDALTGTEQWRAAIEATGAQSRVDVGDVAMNSAGHIFVTGTIYNEALFNGQSFIGDAEGDMFVAAYDPTNPAAALLGLRLIKGGGTQTGIDIAIQNDILFVSGSSNGGFDFGDIAKLPANIPKDAQGPFWVELDPNTLEARWVHTLGKTDAMGGAANASDTLHLAPSPTNPLMMLLAGTAKRDITLSDTFDGISTDIFIGVLQRSQ